MCDEQLAKIGIFIWKLSNKTESNDGFDGALEPSTPLTAEAQPSPSHHRWQHQVKLLKEMMAMEQPNPVVQRVKLIMAAGLMVVHAHRFVSIESRYITNWFLKTCYLDLRATYL